MIRAQRLLPDGEYPLVKRLGLGVTASHLVQKSQSIERRDHIRVIGAQRRFRDSQGPLEQRLGFRIAPLQTIEMSKLAQRLADRGMLGAQRFFLDRQRALIEWLCLRIAALHLVQGRHIVEQGAQARIVRAKPLLTQRQRLLCDRHRLAVVAGLVELRDLTLQCFQIIGRLGNSGGREEHVANRTRQHDHERKTKAAHASISP
jgi:hypothetical protein